MVTSDKLHRNRANSLSNSFKNQLELGSFKIGKPDVLSYSELAAQIKKPKAFRSVSTACAKNRIVVLIPCHRVIRGDGHLGGYRGGIERKRALLDAERANTTSQNNDTT